MQFYAILYRTVFSAQTEFIVLPDILSQYQRLFCCGWGGFFFCLGGGLFVLFKYKLLHSHRLLF